MHRLRRVRARMPGRRHQAGHRAGLEKWLEVNTEYAKSWPNITQKKESPPDAKDFEGMEGKFEKYFSPAPGTGD